MRKITIQISNISINIRQITIHMQNNNENKKHNNNNNNNNNKNVKISKRIT